MNMFLYYCTSCNKVYRSVFHYVGQKRAKAFSVYAAYNFEISLAKDISSSLAAPSVSSF